MQKDLESSHPELEVSILGVNERGQELGNRPTTEGRDIPWLQDLDSDGDGRSDAWYSWQVEWRDVIIVDQNNVRVGVFNLTTHDLAVTENYDTLRQMFIDAAMATPAPALAAGDANGDYRFDNLDIIQVLQGGKFMTGQSATWSDGDFNGDNRFDQLDLILALQTGNYLNGPYAARHTNSNFNSQNTPVDDTPAVVDALLNADHYRFGNHRDAK